MPAESQTPQAVARANQLLVAAGPAGVHLALSGYRFDDGWLYLVVTPTHPGERASQHAHRMTAIERTLRAEGYSQVLLVPSVPEHDGFADVPPIADGSAIA